jgi:hypothetical protein
MAREFAFVRYKLDCRHPALQAFIGTVLSIPEVTVGRRYGFVLNVTLSAYSAAPLAMMRALAYKTLAPSGVGLSGPEAREVGDSDAYLNCDLNRYRRNLLRA